MRRELYRKESVIREWGVIYPPAIYMTRGFLFISRKPQDFLKPRKKKRALKYSWRIMFSKLILSAERKLIEILNIQLTRKLSHKNWIVVDGFYNVQWENII